MPIIVKPSKRKGAKPIIVFRGSVKEANSIKDREIYSAFEKAGLIVPETVKAFAGRKLIANFNKTLEQMRLNGKTSGVFDFFRGMDYVSLKINLLQNGRITVHQQAVVHGVRPNSNQGLNSFQTLKKILKEGFVSGANQSWRGAGNAFVSIKKSSMGMSWKNESKDISNGDTYAIRILEPYDPEFGSTAVLVSNFTPDKILGINISLNRKLTPIQLKQKKAFYKKELKGFSLYFKH